MTNNDILRRLRFLFDYNDQEMIDIFALAEYEVDKTDVVDWLAKEDAPLFKEISDTELAIFLNGVIIEKRGRRDGPLPEPEHPLTNNMILQKLRIALKLTSDDILALFASVDVNLSKHELSAFFRNPKHRSYRECLDQYLRNFLTALQKQKLKRQKGNS